MNQHIWVNCNIHIYIHLAIKIGTTIIIYTILIFVRMIMHISG